VLFLTGHSDGDPSISCTRHATRARGRNLTVFPVARALPGIDFGTANRRLPGAFLRGERGCPSRGLFAASASYAREGRNLTVSRSHTGHKPISRGDRRVGARCRSACLRERAVCAPPAGVPGCFSETRANVPFARARTSHSAVVTGGVRLKREPQRSLRRSGADVDLQMR